MRHFKGEMVFDDDDHNYQDSSKGKWYFIINCCLCRCGLFYMFGDRNVIHQCKKLLCNIMVNIISYIGPQKYLLDTLAVNGITYDHTINDTVFCSSEQAYFYILAKETSNHTKAFLILKTKNF